MMVEDRLADWGALDRRARGKVLEAACAALSLAAAVYVVFSTILMVVDNAMAVPFWDQWDNLISPEQQILSSWLYRQHNEHRILFPRLIFAIDTWLFHA